MFIKGPYPHEELAQCHKHMHHYRFELDGIGYQLTTVEGKNDTDDRSRSIISEQDGPTLQRKSDVILLSFDGILTVNAAVEILKARQISREKGFADGVIHAQHEFQRVIGMRFAA